MSGIRGVFHRIDRAVPITVKAGVLIVAITMATGVALGVIRVVETQARLDETYAVQARSIVALVADQLRRHPGDFAETNQLLGKIVDTHPKMLRIRLFREGPDGRPQLWASSYHTDLPVDVLPDELLPDRQPKNRVVDLGGQRVLLHLEPVSLPNGVVSVGTYFNAAERDEAIAIAKRETLVDTLAIIAVELVALIATLYFLVLRRVKRLGQVAADVAAGDLSIRLPEGDEEPGRDELANVGRQFSHMVEALETREQEQEAAGRERRELLARLLRAEEEERIRIANDLHDDTIQKLTVVGLNLHRVQRSSESEEQRAALANVEESVRLTLDRARHLMFELAPPSLENEGLDMALKRYLAQAAEDGGFAFTFEDRLADDPDAETRNIVYRITQEALVNVRKHAEATNVSVVVAPREGGVGVTISDDGVGFDAIGLRPLAAHLGLPAMQERAALAGGWCTIRSEPGEGVTVQFWIPAQEPGHDDGEQEQQDG